MVIDVINPTTVKITLENEDMLRYGLKFEMLDKSNIETKILLTSIISIVKTKQSIDLDSNRVYIEAFELDDGGCVLYISSFPDKSEKFIAKVRISEKPSDNNYHTLELNSSENLQKFALNLPQEYKCFIKESKLLFNDDNQSYRLVLNTNKKLDKIFQKWASKYCFSMEGGEIPAFLTLEHWECLIENNAIENINEKFLD
ncbi:MAG: hypothetical protein GX896_09565 [Clostridiales bacterium]|nr:hypothetical protein [Clostridiales bacterium]